MVHANFGTSLAKYFVAALANCFLFLVVLPCLLDVLTA